MTINIDKSYIKHQIKWKAFYTKIHLWFYLFIDFRDTQKPGPKPIDGLINNCRVVHFQV